MIEAAAIVLVLAAALFAVRAVIGPSLADRIIAVDGLLAVGCGAIGLEALHSGDGEYIPTIVVITLIAFVGTAVAARFIESQDDDATGAEEGSEGSEESEPDTGPELDVGPGPGPEGGHAVIAEALALFGAVLMLLSAIGVLRFRDVLSRMHALAKASTLGLLFLLGGAALGMEDANDITSLLLAMALQLLTLPVGSNLIAKAAYFSNPKR